MLICKLCSKEFTNNKGGQLTVHLFNNHKLTLEQYVIKTEYCGIPPTCSCGCNLPAPFIRGTFKKFIFGHTTPAHKIEQYLKKFGEPKCLTCGSITSFSKRGNIKKYCNVKCAPKSKRIKNETYGFCNPDVQKKIKQNLLSRYGVDNISKVEFVKEKLSKQAIGKIRSYPTLEHKENLSILMTNKWKDDEFRIKQSALIKQSTNSQTEKLRRSSVIIEKMQNGYVPFGKKTTSKLHLHIRSYLGLEEMGFVSEQNINGYIVDEVNYDLSIVIEINGDYVHANPKIYTPDDTIVLRGSRYSARDKWIKDETRIKTIVDEGYYVFVIWETDDLDSVKEKLLELIYHSYI